MSSNKKIILVIGATGAQGLAIIDALLAPDANGSSSPYVVRALTRDLDSPRAKLLAAKGVECVKGTAMIELRTFGVFQLTESLQAPWKISRPSSRL